MPGPWMRRRSTAPRAGQGVMVVLLTAAIVGAAAMTGTDAAGAVGCMTRGRCHGRGGHEEVTPWNRCTGSGEDRGSCRAGGALTGPGAAAPGRPEEGPAGG